MTSAVTRLTSKLEGKLADKDYYEAHQLYRTIYFRLQRDIKYNTLLVSSDDGSNLLKWGELLMNRMDFVEKNPSYVFLIEFLAKGAETLLQAKELISALDLIKLLLVQVNHFLFQSHAKPGTANLVPGPPATVRSGYYNSFRKWFDRIMDVFHLYGKTGLEMIQNKSTQTKGFVENDFLSERDQLLEQILQLSKNVRVIGIEDKSQMKIRNTFIRDHGLPEMHLRNGKLLMRFEEMGKARHCFIYGQDSFELAKFLYFYHKASHNETEYELVLVKALIKVFNMQLFINAKPGMYRGQRSDKLKKLKISAFSDEEMATVKVQALKYTKEVFYYYLAITKFFMLKDAPADQSPVNTLNHFKQMFLLKYFNFFLILLEELLRQEDTVPAESSYHFATHLVRQMKKHFRFNQEQCFHSDRDAEKFLNFFGSRKDYAESLTESLPDNNAKSYLLGLFYELRTNVYKQTLTFYRKMDRELDVDLLDRVFFAYYNDAVPQNFPDLRDSPEGSGYFEPEESRTAPQPPNLFNILLGGMAGGSSGGGGGAVAGGADLMSFLNEFMQ